MMRRVRNRFEAFLRFEGPFEVQQTPERKVKKPVPYLPIKTLFKIWNLTKVKCSVLSKLGSCMNGRFTFYFRRTILCQARLTAWRQFEKLIYIYNIVLCIPVHHHAEVMIMVNI
jgi:hypothetical protein